MVEVRNFKDLFKYLEKDIQDSMNDVGKRAEEIMKDKTQEVVYDAGTPEVYKRTYDLLNSIKGYPAKVEDGKVIVELGNDESLIISDPGNYTHGSYAYTPSDISGFIDVIVAEGKSGNLFGYGYWREERNYFEATVNELMKGMEHVKTMKQSLKQKGYNIR